MTSWKQHKQNEKRAAWEAECLAREAEERRLHNRTLYQEIEEADADESVKAILRKLAEAANLD